jgi:hypothetical protein
VEAPCHGEQRKHISLDKGKAEIELLGLMDKKGKRIRAWILCSPITNRMMFPMKTTMYAKMRRCHHYGHLNYLFFTLLGIEPRALHLQVLYFLSQSFCFYFVFGSH